MAEIPGPCPASFNLTSYVLAAGQTSPEKVALAMIGTWPADTWTYARLTEAVLGTATGLLEAGLQPGDRLLLRLGNGISFPLAFLGAIAAGILPVPTPIGLTEREVTRVARALVPRMVLASDGVAVPPGVEVMTEQAIVGFTRSPPATPVMGDPDRPAYIILTSGTSGTPQLVVHAHRAIWARRFMWSGWYGLGASDRLAHAGAFNWTYTLGTGLMDPWAIGATALIPVPGISPPDLPALLASQDATIFAAAPGVYRQMLRESGRLDLPALRHGLTAGEKCPESIHESWQAATGTVLHEAFGQSEISTFISGSPVRPAPSGTLGFVQPGRRIAILGVDGHAVEPGQPGVIAVHRTDPGLMLGYWNDAPATANRMTGEWYLTGDTGAMTRQGAVVYLGRNDDMLNSGGFRVSPLEIETAMTEHPEIHEAAAVDVEVKRDTFVIGLWYTSQSELDQQDLAEFAAERLAPYKRPRIFVHAPSLPRNSNGKLLRRALRESYRGPDDKT